MIMSGSFLKLTANSPIPVHFARLFYDCFQHNDINLNW
jgi:hypothetical protein